MPISPSDIPDSGSFEGLKRNTEFAGVVVWYMNQENNLMNITFSTKQG